jgi:hypothetical protein
MRHNNFAFRKEFFAALASLALASLAHAADLNSEAQALQMQGNWAALQKLATDWSRSDPGAAAPWLYLGAADDQLGQIVEAIRAYEKAVSIQPQLATGWMYLAADYHKTGQTQNLADVVRRLQPINPSMAMMLQTQYTVDLQSQTAQAGGTDPSGIPQKAAEALARARQWRADTQLMMIDINDFSNNGNFLVNLYFRSPSSGAGYVVSDARAAGRCGQLGYGADPRKIRRSTRGGERGACARHGWRVQSRAVARERTRADLDDHAIQTIGNGERSFRSPRRLPGSGESTVAILDSDKAAWARHVMGGAGQSASS